jgi:cellulose biosynthesis protein BcsQ
MRALKVLACYSVKGGVGKTATAVNLAWLSAGSGRRTLLWDLDPQAAATFLLRGKAKVRGGSRKLLHGKVSAAKAVRRTPDELLTLLPADPNYHDTDTDCPVLSANVVRAADVLLVPIVPSPLSLRTLDQVVDLAAEQHSEAAVLAFLSMVDKRRALHRDVVELLHGRYGDVAATVIPNSAVVERMGQRRRPVEAFAKTSPAAAAYRSLWDEVVERLVPPG